MPTSFDSAVEALLQRAAEGDRDAAGEVACVYDDRLRRVIRARLDRRLLRRVGVDDVLQETHIEAVRRLPEFLAKRTAPLLIWLRFLAVQRCITLARRHLIAAARDARREQPLGAAEGYDSASVALEQALSGHLTTPSGAAARSEMQDAVRTAVQALAPFDREILCLRHFEQLDNAEAASALGLDPGTTSKRYMRALVRLREVMEAARLDAPSL
jgi:RNA polymerase sigma-70 factor (ECF subfamily)